MIRSSDSIAANLVEGYGRHTPADRKKFYLYSGGSLEESKSWLREFIRRKVLPESKATEYKAIVEKLGPQLNAFINSTKV
ncbi:MAG: four helix bundle protein [Deltaproteobacteria bacterium]|nr:four helix bundle protein [Deltaproteobacteria bacterium]MBW2201346.1 four helix bundle protein [Deltaproteobacteria bacterium]